MTLTKPRAEESIGTSPGTARAALCLGDVAAAAAVAVAAAVVAVDQELVEKVREIEIKRAEEVADQAEKAGPGRLKRSWMPRWRTISAQETPERLRLNRTVAQVQLLRCLPTPTTLT